ncbi:MAG: cytochrome b/b6 domain-containing protein [Actinomycetota bacterium]|nr:cytochrome b/b6 domain-containing protein [Actinomycetota bacterium]MDZ4177659.1 cytochrome b/b6 domain-containing protein [Coriobacteriia bacterium]
MDLVAFNVWLDEAFKWLYVLVILFLVVHFVAGILKGRFRMKFIEKKWPTHDHAPPVQPKLMHASHMLLMVLLGITGMYIRFPYFDDGRIAMRGLHYFAMIFVTVILVMRVWYAFKSKNADWREFAVTRKDLASALGVLAYYGYFSDNKPHVAKYNVMQKLSYQLFLVMMVMMAFTGFALVTTPLIAGTSPRDWLVGWWLGALVGSTDLAGWYMRMLHYILNWGFIIMTTVHVYLSATEDIPVTLDFFGLKKLETVPSEHGHDGHEPDPDPVTAMSGSPATAD